MPPSAADRLADIVEAIGRIQVRIAGRSFDDFASDEDLRLIVERLLQIVCEAAHKLPQDIKLAGSDVDWKGINDFGNVLRHAYHETDAGRVWGIVITDLPPLRTFAEEQRRHLEK
jgi:uncharacterized protein with HEPN domain